MEPLMLEPMLNVLPPGKTSAKGEQEVTGKTHLSQTWPSERSCNI
jgi:hypothetical protein